MTRFRTSVRVIKNTNFIATNNLINSMTPDLSGDTCDEIDYFEISVRYAIRDGAVSLIRGMFSSGYLDLFAIHDSGEVCCIPREAMYEEQTQDGFFNCVQWDKTLINGTLSLISQKNVPHSLIKHRIVIPNGVTGVWNLEPSIYVLASYGDALAEEWHKGLKWRPTAPKKSARAISGAKRRMKADLWRRHFREEAKRLRDLYPDWSNKRLADHLLTGSSWLMEFGDDGEYDPPSLSQIHEFIDVEFPRRSFKKK